MAFGYEAILALAFVVWLAKVSTGTAKRPRRISGSTFSWPVFIPDVSTSGRLLLAALALTFLAGGLLRAAEDPAGPKKEQMPMKDSKGMPGLMSGRLYEDNSGCVTGKLDFWFERGRFSFVTFLEDPEPAVSKTDMDEAGAVILLGTTGCQIRFRIERADAPPEHSTPPVNPRRGESHMLGLPLRKYERLFNDGNDCALAKLSVWLARGRVSALMFASSDGRSVSAPSVLDAGAMWTVGGEACRFRVSLDRAS